LVNRSVVRNKMDLNEIRKAIERLEPPSAIKRFDVRLGEDSSGDDALWIDFYVEDDATPETVSTMQRFTDRVRQVFFDSPQGPWPYIRFKTPP
jgi:hypothetical protein